MNNRLSQEKKVLPLGQILPADERRIGNKSANLNRLLQQGFPVPPGICITSDVFLEAIAPFEQFLSPLLEAVSPGDLTQALVSSQKIRAILENMVLPVGLSQLIWRALQPLSSKAFAVRSSAEIEDLPGASFAGQYQSILGATTEWEIEKAILDCWQSYYSPNGIAARSAYQATRENRITVESPGMAILIQPLIKAECSGVCFSIDPVHLQAEHILVVSSWGLGIGVVSGTIPADTSMVHRTDMSLESVTIADKNECTIFVKGSGLQRVALPEHKRKIACLPDRWLERIAQFGLAIEQASGSPQDMEWAISEQQVWILQSRPITTLPVNLVASVRFPVEWGNEAEPRHFWSRWQVNDVPQDCLLPIESEFIKLRTSGGHAAVEYGGSEKTRWTKLINGRAYIAVADSPLHPGDRRIRASAMTDLFERLQRQNITQWEHWGPEIARTTERLAAFDPQEAGGQALADHLEDTMAAARRHWMIHTLVPRRGYLKPLVDAYEELTGKNKTKAEQDIQFLIQGEETAQTRLIDALYNLAQIIQQTPPVAALVTNRPADVLTHLHQVPEAKSFLEAFEQFMMIFGGRLCFQHRNGSSIALPVTWLESPIHVLEMIATYIPKNTGQEFVSPRESRERAEREYRSRLEALYSNAENSTIIIDEFHRRLAYACRNAAFTDEHNHYIDQLADGQFIQAVIYAGRWLAVRGDLEQFDDVYWLLSEEILAALRSPVKKDLKKVVKVNKDQFTAWNELLAPASLGLPNSQLPERTNNAVSRVSEPRKKKVLPNSTKNELTGQPCSLGYGQGRARRISLSDSIPVIAPGDVLVAKNAGPLWTPLFAILAGIVLDEGYAGAHVAITAREFGIPAVFGVGDATSCIPEGAWVRVDGTNGIVEWE